MTGTPDLDRERLVRDSTAGERWTAMAKVLIIEDEASVTDLVHTVLTDEGFAVATLHQTDSDAIRAAVGRLEPDCILLDSQSALGYGTSWEEAAWAHARERRIPVIMFSADAAATREAEERASERSRRVSFAAILPKPFDIDRLIEAVGRAVGRSVPFDESAEAERARTAALVERLRSAGAREIHASTRREWANFRNPHGAFIQLYWWQQDGVYYLMRHAESGGTLERVGRLYDLEAAIALAMAVQPAEP